VETRIRPIFITTLTTLTGVLPLVVSSGAGSELYRGLGSAVLGGLTLSTIVTLLLVPIVYSLGLDAQRALAGRLPRWRRSPSRALDALPETMKLEGTTLSPDAPARAD
jgi:HAE1 family hydrophobic/amphiphilic exporter-1